MLCVTIGKRTDARTPKAGVTGSNPLGADNYRKLPLNEGHFLLQLPDGSNHVALRAAFAPRSAERDDKRAA